jgi:hypothetical protein
MHRYFSIDIETGGIEHDSALIEIALIYDDLSKETPEDLKSLTILFSPTDYESFDGVFTAGALKMHIKNGLLGTLLGSKVNTVLEPDAVKSELVLPPSDIASGAAKQAIKDWVAAVTGEENHVMHLIGKNAGSFDVPFLRSKGVLDGEMLDHRVLDIGSMMMTILPEFKWAPGLQRSLDVLGIEHKVTHRAIDDALACVKCYRKLRALSTESQQG